MPQLVLQPCSLGEPMRHFEETVLTPVALADYEKLLGADATALTAASENGYVALWGIVPNNKVTTYQRMQLGDRVLFIGNKRGFYTGVVTHHLHNPALASQLWGHDADGRTWEYMYSIGQGAPVDVDGQQLNRAIDYQATANIMGFTILDPTTSAPALELIDASLASGRVRPLTVNRPPRRTSGLAHLTDPEAVVKAMAEYDELGQDAFLAKYGFGPARSFILVAAGREYDSKAIAGAALAHQEGVFRALPATELSGRATGAARKLRQLGFRVETRNDARPGDLLTRESVLAAISEFHEAGREAFLQRHQARPADRYVVVDQGVQLDAKAIIQAAWRHQNPDAPPLQAGDFRGDRSSVAEPLRRLGFWVDDLRSAPQQSEPPLGPDPQAYIDAAKALEGTLDRTSRTTSRVEQQLLRGALGLYESGLGECDLCGRKLPNTLLVAAHIKKRSKCTDQERRELPHIGMRACVLGCDALFERGWLFVTQEGTLDAPSLAEAGDLEPWLAGRRGRVISCATPERAPYFAWHRANPANSLAPAP